MTKSITVEITELAYETLAEAAERQGTTAETFARAALEAEARRVVRHKTPLNLNLFKKAE